MQARSIAPKIVLLAVLSTLSLAAAAPEPGGTGKAVKSPALTLEPIPGTSVKRVILSAKAAERLGIETRKVSEEAIIRRQVVGGLVIAALDKQPESKPPAGTLGWSAQPAPTPQPGASIAPMGPARVPSPPTPMAGGGFAGFGQAAPALEPAWAKDASGTRAAPASQPTTITAVPAATAPGARASARQPGGFERVVAGPASQAPAAPALVETDEAWVLVTLSQAEWERLAKDKPARIMSLGTRDKTADISARPSGMAPREDAKRSMLSVYYVVPNKDHGLTLNKRMRVELQLAGNEEKQKVVPYAAVYYDSKGAPWIYVNTKPLVFERRRVTVDRIVGGLAVVSDGPEIGTPVVTVGAALLYGAEIFGK
jgi:hypothetical protein